MNIPIKGLEWVCKKEKYENHYYFTEKMLNSGIYIKSYQIESPEGTPKEEMPIGEGLNIIEVVCIKTNKKIISSAVAYEVFSRMRLEPLEKYCFIKSIYDLFTSSSVEEFIDSIESLAFENEIIEYWVEGEEFDKFVYDSAKEVLAEYVSLKNHRLGLTS